MPNAATAHAILDELQGRLLRDLRLTVAYGARNQIGAQSFQVFAEADGARSDAPVLEGLANRHPSYPAANWVEVAITRLSPGWTGGVGRPLNADDETQLIGWLGELIPRGGHLMIEYDSPDHRETARRLVAGMPPAATPLGLQMLLAGCGVAFRDWYISEGGREGPRKLQGFKPLDAEHARTRAGESIAALDAFLRDSEGRHGASWEGARRDAVRATGALREIMARFETGEGGDTCRKP